jgi:hypothetical protein
LRDMWCASHAWVHLHRLTHMLSRIRSHGRVAVRKTWVATHTRRRLICRHHLAVVFVSRCERMRHTDDSAAEPRLVSRPVQKIDSSIGASRIRRQWSCGS